MACKICGKGACTESFHSIEEQEEFETKTGRYAPIDLDYEQALADGEIEFPKAKETKK